jgi:hypothetical protein
LSRLLFEPSTVLSFAFSPFGRLALSASGPNFGRCVIQPDQDIVQLVL